MRRIQLGHQRTLRRRFGFRRTAGAEMGSIGTVLLVILVVALMSVVGVYVMGLARMDAPAPELEVRTTSEVDRMYAHISSVSEARPIYEFRLMARHENGTMVLYDSDGDAVGDMAMSHDLDLLTVEAATGPLKAPIVYVDVDGNDRVSSGDYMTYRHPFFPPLAPFIDVTHGYKVVGQSPGGIHRDSDMYVIASPYTLPGSGISTGDSVRVEIAKGDVVYYVAEGVAGIGGVWNTNINIPITWTPATYGGTKIVVRPGEVDEYTLLYPFKVMPENPVSKAEQAYWERLNNPIVDGTDLVLVHKPTNTVVMEITV